MVEPLFQDNSKNQEQKWSAKRAGLWSLQFNLRLFSSLLFLHLCLLAYTLNWFSLCIVSAYIHSFILFFLFLIIYWWLFVYTLSCVVCVMYSQFFWRAVSRCIGAAMICLAWMNEFSVVVLSCFTLSPQTNWMEVLLSWTGRLAQTIVQSDCLFKVMGQE